MKLLFFPLLLFYPTNTRLHQGRTGVGGFPGRHRETGVKIKGRGKGYIRVENLWVWTSGIPKNSRHELFGELADFVLDEFHVFF